LISAAISSSAAAVVGKLANLVGDDRKASARLTCAAASMAAFKRQQVRLFRDVVDDVMISEISRERRRDT